MQEREKMNDISAIDLLDQKPPILPAASVITAIISQNLGQSTEPSRIHKTFISQSTL